MWNLVDCDNILLAKKVEELFHYDQNLALSDAEEAREGFDTLALHLQKTVVGLLNQ